MTPYEMIKTQLDSGVPFAKHVGVSLTEIADGTATATLEHSEHTSNHIKSQHAGAMFSLGEAASGAALAGALAPVIFDTRPVAAEARIAYKKIAQGALKATAKTSEPGADLLATLRDTGKVVLDVDVEITDTHGDVVSEMQVTWHVSLSR